MVSNVFAFLCVIAPQSCDRRKLILVLRPQEALGTIMKKALFDVISLLGDLVIVYRTNLVVTVSKAFRTFHYQCPVHFRVCTIFTGIFRVKGQGRS